MANKLRNLVLTGIISVTMLVGVAAGVAHTGMAAVPHSNSAQAAPVQLADYCPAPPFACIVTRR
ncbi:MAG TPA: hypothetical protein VFQ30_13575 [Ktedonobacteraceae bacterium]|nr:hypothetical protein [Ktedonobacteraceae bacterium]